VQGRDAEHAHGDDTQGEEQGDANTGGATIPSPRSWWRVAMRIHPTQAIETSSTTGLNAFTAAASESLVIETPRTPWQPDAAGPRNSRGEYSMELWWEWFRCVQALRPACARGSTFWWMTLAPCVTIDVASF
jgi:hypothetical protein